MKAICYVCHKEDEVKIFFAPRDIDRKRGGPSQICKSCYSDPKNHKDKSEKTKLEEKWDNAG